MSALLLVCLFVFIAATFGRVVLSRLCRVGFYSGECSGENLVFSMGIGLALIAYCVYFAGIFHLLSFWPVTIIWVLCALVGSMATVDTLRDLRGCIVGGWRFVLNFGFSTASRTYNLLIFMCAISIGVAVVVMLCACFRAPGPLEWDAISYHLADPKLFIMEHRVYSIPTEHHSNFPFTLEMLFTVGLLYNGFALANLFHLVMALLTLGAILAFCSRYFSPLVGWLACLGFITVPVVLWESTIAYIDLGLALFLTISAFTLVSGVECIRGSDGQGRRTDKGRSANEWLVLSSISMGFALGMKYLALVPMALSASVLLVQSVRANTHASTSGVFKFTGLFVVIALIIGSPWYVKNVIVNHNPVYPFYFKVFPASRYWSQDRAEAYQSEQDKFGSKPISKDARNKLINLLSVPWHVLIQRSALDVKDDRALLYCNPGEFTFTALYGGLFAAIVFPLTMLRRVPFKVRMLLWLALMQTAAWFQLSQVGRYLIQIMPLFAVVGAYTVCRMAFGSPGVARDVDEHRSTDVDPSSDPDRGRASPTQRTPFKWPGWLGILCILGQALYVLVSVFTLPGSASRMQVAELMARGQALSSVSVPMMLSERISERTNYAMVSRLRRSFDAFDAMDYINTHSRPDDGVLLYEEVRGFYLDRPYLWGNTQHSSFIPYPSFRRGEDLVKWMQKNHFEFVLINLHQSAVAQSRPDNATQNVSQQDANMTLEEYLFKLWIKPDASATGGAIEHHDPAEWVRYLIGDAKEQGLLTEVYSGHGCLVLKIASMIESERMNRDRR